MNNANGSSYDPDKFNPNVWLKECAAELGIKAKDLLAMAPQRDPFNKGTETDWVMARWFEKVYDRFGYPGIHLRRLHYRISNLGEGGVLLWDGVTVYDNDRYCWNKIQEAFTAARILGLVDADEFVERRVKASRVDSIGVSGMRVTASRDHLCRQCYGAWRKLLTGRDEDGLLMHGPTTRFDDRGLERYVA